VGQDENIEREGQRHERREKRDIEIPQLIFIKEFYFIIIIECDGETSPTTHYDNHCKDPNQNMFS
jgi:hypothetical protein